MLEGCTKDQLLFMAAMSLEACYSGQSDSNLHAIYERLNGTFPGYKAPFSSVMQNLANLCACRLVLSDGGGHRLSTKISLNVVADDVVYVMKQRGPELEQIAERLK